MTIKMFLVMFQEANMNLAELVVHFSAVLALKTHGILQAVFSGVSNG